MAFAEVKASLPPEVLLNGMCWGFEVSQALHTAAKLAVFDALGDGPKTADEIASAVVAHAPR